MENSENARLMCSNCGGILEIDSKKTTVKCSFCGSCFSVSDLLGESERVQIERIRRDVELGRQNLELERMRQSEAAARRNANIRNAETFKKSAVNKVSIVLAVISLLMCITGFAHGVTLMGIIAAIQSVLFALTFLIGQQTISIKARKLNILPFSLALLLEVPFVVSVASSDEFRSSNSGDSFSWNEIVLSDRLPELNSESGYISKNTRSELMMNVYNVPIKQYYGFVEDCKEMGYTLESSEDDNSYRAFAEDGFKLYVRYSVLHDGTVDINLFASKQEAPGS